MSALNRNGLTMAETFVRNKGRGGIGKWFCLEWPWGFLRSASMLGDVIAEGALSRNQCGSSNLQTRKDVLKIKRWIAVLQSVDVI
jgi:hypothetical protein